MKKANILSSKTKQTGKLMPDILCSLRKKKHIIPEEIQEKNTDLRKTQGLGERKTNWGVPVGTGEQLGSGEGGQLWDS